MLWRHWLALLASGGRRWRRVRLREEVMLQVALRELERHYSARTDEENVLDVILVRLPESRVGQ